MSKWTVGCQITNDVCRVEFLNTLNNSISGSIYVRTKKLNSGPACVANGFVNQLTVQAVDFTILAIVIVTLLTITQKTYLPSVSFQAKTIICLSTWAVPIITSITALAIGAMSPVSGNWCWITAKRTDLRYALTHGWRIAIIFLTVLLYGYIWWYVHNHFKALFGSQKGRSGGYNPLTGAVTSQKDTPKDKEREEVPLKGSEHPLNNMIDSMDTRTNGDPEGLIDARSPESSNLSTESPIQSTTKRSGDTYHHGISDAAMRGWSPLQKSFQAGSAKQHLFLPPNPGTRQGREFEGTIDTHGGIVRSYDIHVSFSEQNTIQKLPLASGHTDPSPLHQFPGTAWPGPQMADSSGTTTNSFSAKRHLVHTNTETCSYIPNSSAQDAPLGRRGRGFEREVRRMLLLNAYPTLYVLLWIPGIVNRFMEATGTSPSNTRIVGALQSTSQFVGFANALTFGLSATMRRRIASSAPGGRWMGRTREQGV